MSFSNGRLHREKKEKLNRPKSNFIRVCQKESFERTIAL